MKKKLTALACILTITCSVLLSGCRSVSVSSKSEDTTEKKTTSESSTKKNNKETTTKKNKETEKETTTKKSSEEESTLAWDPSTDTSSWKTYTKTGYTIKASESDWLIGVIASADFAIQHSTTGDGPFADNINVVIQDLSAYKMDLDAYKDLSFQQYKQLNYNVLSSEKVSVNGSVGYYITVQFEKDGYELTCGQYFTIIDNKAYVFTLNADTDDFYLLESDFFDILYTVQFDSIGNSLS